MLEEILKQKPDFLPARLQNARELSKAGRFQAAADEAELVVRNVDPANRELLRAAHLFLVQV